MPYRRVVKSDPANPGIRTVEVEHLARWRAGPLLTGTLSTRLLVEEDPSTGTVAFRLAPGGPRGFMAAFEGAWRVAPMSQGALDAVLGSGPVPAAPVSDSSRVTVSGWPWEAVLARVAGALPGGGGPGSPPAPSSSGPPLPPTGASLVTLSQSVGPRLHIPPPIDRLVTAICARQVKGLLSDLRAEAARRRHRAAGDWADGGGIVAANGQAQLPPEPAGSLEPALPRRRVSKEGGRGRALLW